MLPRAAGRARVAARAAPPSSPEAELRALVEALAPSKSEARFLGADEAQAAIEKLAERGARVEQIGTSGEGRPMFGVTVGHGPIHVGAIAGAHPDEPVGTSTLLHLLEAIATRPELKLAERITLHAVPLANPDGTARNQRWFKDWGTPQGLKRYLTQVRRDSPANDVEFGFGDERDATVRPENRALGRFLTAQGPLDHFVSLHSMFMGGGGLFLATANDLDAHRPQLDFLVGETQRLGLPLHDKDRFGQKGFWRLGPGLQTAPTAREMREFFAAGGRDDVAQRFKLNSMQWVQRNADCPLALVTEMPLLCERRISSNKKLRRSRADEELRLAAGMGSALDEAQGWVGRLRAAAGKDAAALDAVDRFAGSLDSGRAAVASLQNDLARYGDARATFGNTVETDLNVLRRRIALVGQAWELAGKLPAKTQGPLRRELFEKREALMTELTEKFELELPRPEVQMQAQTAAVLAALLGPPRSPHRGASVFES
ncbi:MAG: hypothetical protein IPJ65_40520 [Archangiaceae bacterium]|nr:hypothetical protein [Archangiaceae bacterium]